MSHPDSTMSALQTQESSERRTTSSAQSATLALVSRSPVTGKTTCAVNLAAAIAKRGLRTAVIDLDRGGFATGWLIDSHQRHEPTIREVLLGAAEIQEALRPSRIEHVDAIPALPTLADVEQLWGRSDQWQETLRKAIAPLQASHPVIILDCPPGISHLMTGALVAASGFLMVAAPKPDRIDEVPAELAAIAQAWDLSGSHAKLMGVLLNRLAGTLDTKMALFTELQKRLGAAILPTPLLEDQIIAECRSRDTTVFDHGHAARIVAKFDQLAEALTIRLCLELPLKPTPESAPGSAPDLLKPEPEARGSEDEEHLERLQSELGDIELETIEAKDITEFNPKADNPLPATPPKGGRLDPDSEREMCKMAAERLGMPFVSLEELEVTPELIEAVPGALMRQHEIFPIGITDVGLRVAMANPFDESAKAALERATGKRVFLCVGVETEVKRLIRRHARD